MAHKNIYGVLVTVTLVQARFLYLNKDYKVLHLVWHPAFQQQNALAAAGGNFTNSYMNNELYGTYGDAGLYYISLSASLRLLITFLLFVAQHAFSLAMQNAEYGQALQQMGFPQSQLALPQVQ